MKNRKSKGNRLEIVVLPRKLRTEFGRSLRESQ
jgi:hypothetical protein